MATRSLSPNPKDNSTRTAEEEEEQQEQEISNVDRDIMGITSQGRPPRVSRRRRSEYAPSWPRAASQPRTGHTGSRNRSTSRHWDWICILELNWAGWMWLGIMLCCIIIFYCASIVSGWFNFQLKQAIPEYIWLMWPHTPYIGYCKLCSIA